MRKALVLDANVVMLLVARLADVAYIARHKNLRKYAGAPHGLLSALVDQAPAVATTTHALTEASNLLRQCGDPMRTHVMQTMAVFVHAIKEIQPTAEQVVRAPEFLRLGLTDAAFMQLDPARYELISCDADLVAASLIRGFEAVNLDHLLFD